MVTQENDIITERVSWNPCLSFLYGDKRSRTAVLHALGHKSHSCRECDGRWPENGLTQRMSAQSLDGAG